MAEKAAAHVTISKAGPHGHPVAHVMVNQGITSSQLGGLVEKVATNEAILKAAGLRACTGCKSGLDINILDEGEVFQVNV